MLMRTVFMLVLLIATLHGMAARAALPPHVQTATSHVQRTPAYSHAQPSRRVIDHRLK